MATMLMRCGDLLTGYIELPLTVCFFFPDEPSEYVQKEIDKLVQVFRDAADEGYEVTVLNGYEKSCSEN